MKKTTAESFLEKAHKVHGSLYDYSLTNYVNSRTSIKVICPTHGVYHQTPTNHLKGQRCGKCFGNTALTTEDFIKRAREKHGDLYGYEKSAVTRSVDLVEIQCQTHGPFFQTAASHMKGHGCFKCGRYQGGITNRLTTEEFVGRSNKLHKGVYDYTKTVVLDSVKKVIVTCQAHGDFVTKPSAHLSGYGCASCGFELGGEQRALTTAKFIELALKKHNSFYLYEKTEYTRTNEKITITCPVHGEFIQTPEQHLGGSGCSKCRDSKLSLDRRSSKEEFVAKANKIHHGFYDYSLSNYVNSMIKVEIECPKHGSFHQKPANHLNGKGCPTCSFSKGELFLLGVFKEHSIQYTPQYKLPIYKHEYDFYLPDYNVFIEFHGVQHYKPVAYFGGEEAFTTTRKRDMFKRELARGYGISVVYFNHIHLESLSAEEFKKLILDTLATLKERRIKSWVCIGE